MTEQLTIFDLIPQPTTPKTCRTCTHFRRAYGYDDYWCCFESVISRSNNCDQEACEAYEGGGEYDRYH